MSATAVSAVITLVSSLPSDEFRLLMAIADGSSSDGYWLRVQWDHVRHRTGFTDRQVNRLLSGLFSDGIYVRGEDDQLWIAGMPSPYERTAPVNGYKKKVLSPSKREQVFARDGYRCKRCGTGEALTVDHVYPEVRGGSSELDNLQTLCRPCNSIKGAKIPDVRHDL